MTTADLTYRGSDRIAKTVPARELWDKVSYAALGLRRSGHPVPHFHQRLAHLPAGGR